MFLRTWSTIRKKQAAVLALAFLASVGLWLMPVPAVNVRMVVEYAEGHDNDVAQLFFNMGDGYVPEHGAAASVIDGKAEFEINPDFLSCAGIRLDPGTGGDAYRIKRISLRSKAFKNGTVLLTTVDAQTLGAHAVPLGTSEAEEGDGCFLVRDAGGDAAVGFDDVLTGRLVRAAKNNWLVKLFAQFGIGVCAALYLLHCGRGKKAAAAGVVAAGGLLVCALFLLYVFWGLPDKYYIHEAGPIQGGGSVFELNGKTLEGVFLKCQDPQALSGMTDMEVVFTGEGGTYVRTISAEALQAAGGMEIRSERFREFSGGELEVRIRPSGAEGELPVSIDFLYENTDYKWLIVFCAVLGGGLIVFALLSGKSRLGEKRAVLAIYFLLFAFAAFKMWYYAAHVGQSPDEKEHVAYIAYLEESGKVIPEFADMRQLDTQNDFVYQGGTNTFRFGRETNYLGHPPLYYHMMRLSGGVSVDGAGNIRVDYARLRGTSALMALAALSLWFYIGYRWLDRRHPLQHLLYGTAMVCVPMLCFGGAGVSNDTLTFLGGALAVFGMLRFVREERDWKTYWTIALGVAFTLLGKVTAGAMTVLAIWAYLIWELWTRRKPKEIFKAAFWPTVAVYALVIAYFVIIYRQVGSLQPSYQILDYEGYTQSWAYTPFEDRASYSVGEYVIHYLSMFFYTWSGWCTSFFSIYKTALSDVVLWLVPAALWLVPFLLFGRNMHMEKAEKRFLQMTYVSVLFVFLLQFKNAYDGFFFKSGYLGGMQSRYYLCLLGVFAYVWARFHISVSEKEGRAGRLVKGISAGAVAVFLYGDLIYFLIKYMNFYC